MHSTSTALPLSLISAWTFYRFSVLTFCDLINASINALWAGCILSSSNSIIICCRLARCLPPEATAAPMSLIYIDSARMWSIMWSWVWGSFFSGLPIIWAPAYPIGLFPFILFKCPLPFLSSSIFELSLKNTLRKTSSFFECVSSYFTLL